MHNILRAAALRIQYNSGGPSAIHGDPSSISRDPLSRPERHRTSDSAEGLKNNHLNGCFPFTFWPTMTAGGHILPIPKNSGKEQIHRVAGAHQDMDEVRTA